MPVLLFKLNGVPEDEANDVRELLKTHGIGFYETSAGRFGIAVAAIWLRDDSTDLARARQLIEAYQNDRAHRARSEYAALCEAGQNETLWDRLRLQPLRVAGYVAVVLFILWLSLVPFYSLIQR